MTNDLDRFRQLLRAGHACIWIPTTEEHEALELVRTAAAGAPHPLWTWSASAGLRDGVVAGQPALPNTESALPALHAIAARAEPAFHCLLDLVGHLGDERVLRALRDCIAAAGMLGGQVVLIDHADDLPAVVRSHATRFDLGLPGAPEIEKLVRNTLRRLHRERPFEIRLSQRTLGVMVKNLSGLNRRQVERVVREAVTNDEKFTAEDLNDMLAHKRRLLCDSGPLEYIQSPATLDSIGGLGRVKAWLTERGAPIDERAREYGLSPARGVLLLGVQGAGKSLCAKAAAAAWGWPLFRLDPGALYDRYVGESEKRLRDALRQADAMAPVVLWIDEIEKGFASAASHSTDGGLSQRMFGTLLTWMQEHESAVFLVATANDIEALPPELLRKGRFDEIFFVDLPGEEARRQIVEIHLRKRGRDPAKFDVEALVGVTRGRSGAEIEQGIVAALHGAFAAKEDLTTERVAEAVRGSPPLSVTMAEKIASLRAWAKERCVPAE